MYFRTIGIVIQHLETTAYYPPSNGMVERWHRTPKSAIKCHVSEDWTSTLPIVLLGLRRTVKAKTHAVAAPGPTAIERLQVRFCQSWSCPISTGPFNVLGRSEKYFRIQMHQRDVNISIDRLKAALAECSIEDSASTTATNDQRMEQNNQWTCLNMEIKNFENVEIKEKLSPDRKTVTRSGRHDHFPQRFL